MTKTFGVMVAVLALAAAPAIAQSKKAGATAGSTDAAFAKEAAIGGMAEVELGNLAQQWASSKHVTLPSAVDAKAKATHDHLAKLSGDAFDKAYMHDMVTDHHHDIAAFKKESTSGADADLKAWAGKTLPTLEDHLKNAQDVSSKVGAPSGGTKHKTKHKKHTK